MSSWCLSSEYIAGRNEHMHFRGFEIPAAGFTLTLGEFLKASGCPDNEQKRASCWTAVPGPFSVAAADADDVMIQGAGAGGGGWQSGLNADRISVGGVNV